MNSKKVLIADPAVLQIPIKDNNEELVSVVGKMFYGPSPEIPDRTDYLYVRKTVLDKLLEAQLHLPEGYKLRLDEGLRSLKVQNMIFNSKFANILKQNSNLFWDEAFTESTRLVSPVKNIDLSMNVPPHSTGAAVDVCLVDDTGKQLDMGFDPSCWMEDISGLSQTDCKDISSEARRNRDILKAAMEKVGFTNYWTEFWHYSYGDRFWAFVTGKDIAIYGSVEFVCTTNESINNDASTDGAILVW